MAELIFVSHLNIFQSRWIIIELYITRKDFGWKCGQLKREI